MAGVVGHRVAGRCGDVAVQVSAGVGPVGGGRRERYRCNRRNICSLLLLCDLEIHVSLGD